MEIKKIDEEFSVCQVEAYTYANLDSEYCFLGKLMRKSLWYAR